MGLEWCSSDGDISLVSRLNLRAFCEFVVAGPMGSQEKTGSVSNRKNQRVFSHFLCQTRREKWHAKTKHPSFVQRRSEVKRGCVIPSLAKRFEKVLKIHSF